MENVLQPGFSAPGSSGDLLYRALAGLCSILCPLPVMCGDGILAGASGQVSSGGKDFMKHSFFLYAVHFALVRLINKGAAMLMGGAVPEWYGPFGLFLVMPLLVLLISTVMEKTLRRYMPGLWKLLTGDR